MGQYLQGTQKSVQAWTIHGLAVKAAFQLGLHSKHATGAFSPLDQETRRRTWYACIVLDRYGQLSSLFRAFISSLTSQSLMQGFL